METNDQLFLGLAYQYWSLLCLGVACLYYFIWPKPAAFISRSFLQHFILRYFHALVWIILAIASLLRVFNDEKIVIMLTEALVWLALFIYLIFIIFLLQERRIISKRKS